MFNIKNINFISLENITKFFDDSLILNNINVKFEKKYSYAITGRSGSGKSTLISLLSGLEKPNSGNIYYNDFNLNNLMQYHRQILLQKSIGIMFQYPYLIKELTIIENILLKSLINNNNFYGLEDQAKHLLDKIGLFKKANNYPNELSGGEQQRVSFARALFNKPDFLIADEPTAHLDLKTKMHIIELILSLKEEYNIGLIITSHDELLYKNMDKIINLESSDLTI